MITIERESIELVPVTVTLGGETVTENVTLALMPDDDRPVSDDFDDPEEFEGGIGVLVDGPTLGAGYFQVWYKVADSPETPVGVAEGLIRIL